MQSIILHSIWIVIMKMGSTFTLYRATLFALLSMGLLFQSSKASALVGASSDGEALSSSIVMVLKSTKGRASFCSASVIEKNIILTAAHCSAEPEHMMILLRRKGFADVFLQVEAVKVHPLYNAQSITNRRVSIDLALLRVNNPADGSLLPLGMTFDYQPRKESPVLIAGFGQTNEKDRKSEGHLRQSEIYIREPLSNILIWADGGPKTMKGACSGDSGGPLIDPVSRRIIAVTAWASGSQQSQCGSLTQGILLKPHLNWIRTSLEALKRPSAD